MARNCGFRIKVTCVGVGTPNASQILARVVVDVSRGVIVAGPWIGASEDVTAHVVAFTFFLVVACIRVFTEPGENEAEARGEFAAARQVEIGLRVVVACERKVAASCCTEVTRSVVFCRSRVVVYSFGIGASEDFFFVTHAIAIEVIQAHSVAVHKL